MVYILWFPFLFPVPFLYYYFFVIYHSGRCFTRGVVSSGTSSPSALTRPPHMVALVSLPSHPEGRRGLTLAPTLSQDQGPLFTVAE